MSQISQDIRVFDDENAIFPMDEDAYKMGGSKLFKTQKTEIKMIKSKPKELDKVCKYIYHTENKKKKEQSPVQSKRNAFGPVQI